MAFDWKALVGQVAPVLGTALGGPLGGIAVAAIGKAIGLDNPTEDRIATALAGATPEQRIALQQAEEDFKVQMAQAGFHHEEAMAGVAEQDTASARQREMSVRDWTPALLAIGVTCGFFGILAYMLLQNVPEKNAAVLNIMLGSLGTAWVQVMHYYFGSSSGSDRKTEIMAQGASDAS
jgi:hypothetical protein